MMDQVTNIGCLGKNVGRTRKRRGKSTDLANKKVHGLTGKWMGQSTAVFNSRGRSGPWLRFLVADHPRLEVGLRLANNAGIS